jgi:hypothetical protein
MTYKADPIAAKLDKLAEATGFPRVQRRLESDRRPGRPRVLPSLLLAVVVIGMAVQIARPGWSGFWIVWAGWIGTTFVYQQLGPLGSTRKRDEREAALFRHGHLVGLMWAFAIAVIGSLAVAFGKLGAMIHLWRLWAPESPMDWMTITLFLLALEVDIAVLAASAATPEPLDDDD